MKPFTRKVIEVIKGIPEGYVMTYGQIARVAGNARGARQVVRILHTMSAAHQLPWHRVVNVKGEVAIKEDEARSTQLFYLSSEGVAVEEGRVDLSRFLYTPDSVEIEALQALDTATQSRFEAQEIEDND